MPLTRLFAATFGAVYTLVGLLGFAVAPHQATHQLIVFDVNLTHNLVHLAIGFAGLVAFASGAVASRSYAVALAVVYAVVAVAGFAPQPLLGIIPVGGADIALHAATAMVAAYVAIAGARRLESLRNA